MPLRPEHKRLVLPRNGINLYISLEDLLPGDAVLMQNCYYRRGVQMKLGSNKHSNDEVTASKAIVGLHRFYYGASSKQLIAAAGTNVAYMNDSTGAWTNIRTVQTDNLQTFFTTWSAINKMYVCNGTDQPFTWDGTTASDVAALPVTTKMVLPYRSYLAFIDGTNPSYLSLFDTAYSDSGSVNQFRIVGGGPIQVIAAHALAGPQEGIVTYIFVATASTITLFSGTVFSGGSLNARLDPISDRVGCISAKTVKTTTKGTIFLGSDRQVYILPFGSSQVVPIGHKIRNPNVGTDGIEDIPLAQLSKACAIYHDGFYKLSVAGSGATTNNRQWWLDVDRLSQDEHGLWGPWYGPMIGMAISEFAIQDGSGDDGKLLGGNSGATGYVYRHNEAATYADDGTAISMYFQTANEIYSNDPSIDTQVTKTEVECTNSANTFNLSFFDTIGQMSTTSAIAATQSLLYWGVGTWGDGSYWNDVGVPNRILKEHFDKYFVGRQISTAIDYSSSTDALQVFSITHEHVPIEQSFQVRA